LHNFYSSEDEEYILEEMPQVEPVEPIEDIRQQPTDIIQHSSSQSHIDDIVAGLQLSIDSSDNNNINIFDQTFLPQQPLVEQTIVQVVHRPVENDLTSIVPTLRTDLPNPMVKPMETSVVYPDHPLKANGISYVAEGRGLYATHRGRDDKKMVFGLTKLEQNDYPLARLGVYLSMPGVHETITACPSHASAYSTNNVMNIYFKGQEQTFTQNIENHTAVMCPLVDAISDDNDRTYEIKFTCFSSCVRKTYKGEKLFLNFVIVANGKVLWKDSTLLQVTANPGRDSKKFSGDKKARPVKRKSDEFLKEPPVKREPTDDCIYIDPTPMVSPSAKDLIEDNVPSNVSADEKKRFRDKMNKRIEVMMKHEIKLEFGQT